MNLVAIKDGKLLDPSLYSWNDETNEFSTKESNVYIICHGRNLKLNVGNNCKIFDLHGSTLDCGEFCFIQNVSNSKINSDKFLTICGSEIRLDDGRYNSKNIINTKYYSTLLIGDDNIVNCDGGNTTIACGNYNKINSNGWIKLNSASNNEIITKENSEIYCRTNCKIESGDKSIIHCGSESGIKCGNLSEIFVSNFQKNHVKIESIGKIFLTIDDERKEVEISGEIMLIEKNLYKIEKIP